MSDVAEAVVLGRVNEDLAALGQHGAKKVHHVQNDNLNTFDSQVQAKVMSLAEQFDIPLKPENVSITRNERRTVINAVYTDEVELVPTKFYPWEFKVSVEALNLTP